MREVPVAHADDAMAAAILSDTRDPLLRQISAEPMKLESPSHGMERLVAPQAVVATEDPDVMWVADAATACLYQVNVATGSLTLKVGIYNHPARPGNQARGHGDEITIGRPLGLARAAADRLYVADSTNHRITRVQAGLD